jgi:hypothetical protein
MPKKTVSDAKKPAHGHPKEAGKAIGARECTGRWRAHQNRAASHRPCGLLYRSPPAVDGQRPIMKKPARGGPFH